MRSKVAKRMLANVPDKTKVAVMEYADRKVKEQKLIKAAPQLLHMLKCFVDAIDIIVLAEGAMAESDRQVYVRLQKSDTYKLSKEAIKAATE